MLLGRTNIVSQTFPNLPKPQKTAVFCDCCSSIFPSFSILSEKSTHKSRTKVRKEIGEKMASVRKHGKKWQADIRLKGTRKTKLFKTRMEAQRWALEQEETVKPGLHGVKWTFRHAMERYAKEESVKKRGARWEIIRLKKLCRHPIADKYLQDLTPEDFKSWMSDQRDLSPSSILRGLVLKKWTGPPKELLIFYGGTYGPKKTFRGFQA